MHTATFLWKCSQNKSDVHVSPFLFHEDCAKAWDVLMQLTKREFLFDRCPVLIDKLTDQMAKSLVLECAKNHVYTGEFCKGCKLLEQECWRFAQCGRCKNAKYCSDICQRADWQKHKMNCEIK